MRTPIDQQPYWHLTLCCPHCQAKGMVPWDRIKAERRLCCRGCKRWYRVTGQAQLVPADPPEEKLNLAVRTSFSSWQKFQRVGTFGPRSLTDPKFWGELLVACLVGFLAAGRKARLAAIAVILLSVAGAALRPGPAPVETPAEPVSAAERAPIFGKAWACRDFATMAQLTLPQETSQLREWVIGVKRPPALLDAEAGDVTATALSVVPQPNTQQAVVLLRVDGRSPEGKQTEATSGCQQSEIWIERDGKWFFSPKETLAKFAATAGA